MILPKRTRAALDAVCLAGSVTWLALAPITPRLLHVPSFGPNPTQLAMYLYVPARLASASPAIIVGLHWCYGSAQAFYDRTGYRTLADRYGFIVVYPSSAHPDRCWDVHSSAVSSGGGDALGIVSMVRHAIATQHADAQRVFVTGHSSGGMMSNVLLAVYPDVFRAGAAFAGVPFSCFSGEQRWHEGCASGQVTRTAEEWGEAVRSASPSYAGPRPRMQLFHGMNDELISPHNLQEEIKQWTNVLGVSETPSSVEHDAPFAPFVRKRYRDGRGVVRVEAVEEHGQQHNLQILANEVVRFFELDGRH